MVKASGDLRLEMYNSEERALLELFQLNHGVLFPSFFLFKTQKMLTTAHANYPRLNETSKVRTTRTYRVA